MDAALAQGSQLLGAFHLGKTDLYLRELGAEGSQAAGQETCGERGDVGQAKV